MSHPQLISLWERMQGVQYWRGNGLRKMPIKVTMGCHPSAKTMFILNRIGTSAFLFAGKSYCTPDTTATSCVTSHFPIPSPSFLPTSFQISVQQAHLQIPVEHQGVLAQLAMSFSRTPGFVLSSVSKLRSISHATCSASGTHRERKCRGCQKQQ